MGNFFNKSESEPEKNNKQIPLSIYTFGDSILDCGRYNRLGITPGQLLLENNDELYPLFKDKTLPNLLGRDCILNEYANDGSTVVLIPKQTNNLVIPEEEVNNSIALLTVGGNDMLCGLIQDAIGSEIDEFESRLTHWLDKLPIRPIFIANVYDPTFNDDSKNFIQVNNELGRKNQKRINDFLEACGNKYGAFVDLKNHFLEGKNADWFCNVIEPSEIGVSEVRSVFLDAILNYYKK